MHFLSAFAFLSVIVMARAEDDISKDLDIKPLSELLFVFDVTSDAPEEDIRGSLENITDRRHSFKVIGENRYFFVIQETDVEKLHQLNFPIGSTVTQYPVEHLDDFFEMLSGTHGLDLVDESDLDNVATLMGETTYFVPENTPMAVYKAMTEPFVRFIIERSVKLPTVFYIVLASYPPKMIYFFHVDVKKVQHFVLSVADKNGGPGNRKTHFKRIIKF